MYALSVGIQNLSRTLPHPVYALLSGLNAATVGIVAVSAVQLAEKAIRDRISRILIIFGACAGLCYNSLWYFPVLMIGGGLAIAVWDGWLYAQVQRAKSAWRNRHNPPVDSEEADATSVEMDSVQTVGEESATIRSRKKATSDGAPTSLPQTSNEPSPSQPTETEENQSSSHVIRIRTGIAIVTVFFGRPLTMPYASSF